MEESQVHSHTVDVVDVAQFAAIDDLLHGLHGRVVDEGVTYHGDQSQAVSRDGYGSGLSSRGCEWLFNQHMLSCPQSKQRKRTVSGNRGGQNHCVYVGGQHLLVAGGGSGFRIEVPHVVQAILPEVAHPFQLRLGHLVEVPGQLGTPVAAPDYSDLDHGITP
ncbi:MAG TPA: hypothetical protein VHS28_02900 [Chloroflexota bacterium]|nr:hypothetical protein [Chloroflexota bacterium]